MTGRLDGKRALVVGASRGIGRAIAERYVEEDAAVALAARSHDELERIADTVDGDAIAVECDVREAESVNRAVERAVETFGGLDAIVNSAGVVTREAMVDARDEDIVRVVDVNLVGAMRLARAGIPELIETGGTLVHVSSEAGQRGVSGLPAYCASKGGLDALTRQLAIDYAADGVTVNAIAPGTTKTPINEPVRKRDPEWETRRAANIPLGRLAEPDDMTGAAVFLASDEARHVTGEILAIDGGTTAQ